MRCVTWVVVTLASLMPMTAAAASQALSKSDAMCASAARQAEVVAARTELKEAPASLAASIKLTDLLLNAGCYDEAVSVLEASETLHPHNSELQYRLNRARSMVRENVYFEGLDRAEASAELRRQQFRCTQLADVQACDAAQTAAPDNADIALAKGNALLKANRTDDAISVLSHAARLSPDNARIASELQSARSQRQALMQKCTGESGESALQACESVLSAGSPSEFDVTVRIALLQQSAHRSAQALDSYIAANALHPGDKSVALAIVALLDSTQRQDALGLEARGTSLMVLGRSAEAVTALRQASVLAPGLPNIQEQLEAAQAQARAEGVPQTPSVARENPAGSQHSTVSKPAPIRVSESSSPAHPLFTNDEPASRSN
jgi:tetratricopeptide (TPR) repeat protein